MVHQLKTTNGVQYSAKTLLIEKLKDKIIDRLIVRKNMNYAYTDKGGIYKWGHLPSGLNLTPHDETIDIPVKDKEL